VKGKSARLTEERWTLDEIEVDVSGFFTTHHYMQSRSGALGEFTFPAFSQRAIYYTCDGRELLMQKTHWLGSAHELVERGVVRGRADRPGLFRRDLTVWFEGQEYSLEPGGLLSWDWCLVDAGGTRLLEIRPRGVLKEGAYVTITAAIDTDLVAFAYYLVYTRRQEEAAGAAAASGAAAS
jgi:hypothetical protein